MKAKMKASIWQRHQRNGENEKPGSKARKLVSAKMKAKIINNAAASGGEKASVAVSMAQ